MKSAASFILGAFVMFALYPHFKPNIPQFTGGQLCIYKWNTNPDSLLYIFTGSTRFHNWNLHEKQIREAINRKDPDWLHFDLGSLIVKDIPK